MAGELDHEKGMKPIVDDIHSGTSTGVGSNLNHSKSLKTSNDGHTVLIPQPSNDPDDPLNWTQSKKNVILMVISATAFLADFGSSMGAVTSVVQSNAL